MKTLVAFDNIVIYVFHFNLTAILCISVLTVTCINLLLTYLYYFLFVMFVRIVSRWLSSTGIVNNALALRLA